jgi:hypothetical protein
MQYEYETEGGLENEPVKYIEKTRSYYEAQGFDRAYKWANNAGIPWHRLSKPLSECNVTFIVTAVPDGTIPKLSRQGGSFALDEMPDAFRTDELSWDKQATHTRDRESYIPMVALQQLAEEGVIGSVSARYHFVPTEYSQSNTLNSDAPAIRDACLADEVDIAILVPL